MCSFNKSPWVHLREDMTWPREIPVSAGYQCLKIGTTSPPVPYNRALSCLFWCSCVIGRTCLQRLSLKMLHAKDLYEEVYFALSFGQFKSICCGERDVHSECLRDVIYDTSVLWVAIALVFSVEKVQQNEVQNQFTQPHSDAMTIQRKRKLRLSYLGYMHHPLGWSFEGKEALSQGPSHFLK